MLMPSAAAAFMFGEVSSNTSVRNGRNTTTTTTTKAAGLWGPSHSFASDDDEDNTTGGGGNQPLLLTQGSLRGGGNIVQQQSQQQSQQQHQNQRASTSNGTHTTKSDTASSADDSPTQRTLPIPLVQSMTLERIFESASAAVESLVKTATGSSSGKKVPNTMTNQPAVAAIDTSSHIGNMGSPTASTTTRRSPPTCLTRSSAFELFVEQTCTSPCTPRQLSESPPRRSMAASIIDDGDDERPSLGKIIPLVTSPAKSIAIAPQPLETSVDTPINRRKKRRAKQQLFELPMASFTVQPQMLRSISELTMKSSYGEATSQLSENRRMAYYAVGKHHTTKKGGNRRCYFTGKLIFGGAPFYAGSVQQGLRTLVVFCLPSAVGLPKEGVDHLFLSRSGGSLVVPRIRSIISKATTSLDDMSFLEEELDPNWDVDRDFLLQVLPEPDKDLLDEMAVRYPDQFETLPVQVRSEHCWRLFIKFCFFSGLPIAEGELHYKVIDEVANEVYGEEIILSHEVMEAVNGESAEILRLPNLKTFKYLRKHYTQQSGKLADAAFRRTSWEMVRPEI